jgi:hypothetical protein
MRVYHFMASQYALISVALRRSRLSRYGDLNDPFELFAADLGEKNLRPAIRAMKQHFDQTQGILCFSKTWNNPVLWSHYADKHRGIALGFDIDDRFIVEIDYSDDRIPMEYIDNNPESGVTEAYVNRLVRTKYKHWIYEDEVRLVFGLDESTLEGGSYFVPFDDKVALREIMLGPLCEIPVETVKALVKTLYTDVVVRKARLAFSKFAVEPDQRYEAEQGDRVV